MDSNLIHVPLTPLDHLPPPWNPSGVVYFGLKPGFSNAQAFAHLQEGLYRAFLQTPWINGKVHKQSPNTPGWRPGQLEIRYNPNVDDSDKPRCYQLRFNELESAPSYAELKANGFPIDTFEDSDLHWQSISHLKPDSGVDVEVIAAQANFIPGGCILVASLNHAACDATGMNVVFKIWAENCRALSMQSEGRPESGFILPEESWDRTLLQRIWTKEATGHSIRDMNPETWELIGLEAPGPGQDGLIPSPVTKPPLRAQKMTSRFFYMSPTALMKLRMKCNEELGTKDLTGNDVLLALIWRSLMNARMAARKRNNAEADIDMDSLVEIQVARDAREDFRPLPPFYVGNCIFHHQPTIPLRALVGPDSSVASVAQDIRTSARKVNHENIMDAYMLVQKMPDYRRLQPPRFVALDNTWLISSMLNLYEEITSFGDHIFTNGGRPEAFRPLMDGHNRDQVAACFVLPRKKHGGIEIVMSLFEDEWPFLLEEGEFGHYAYLV